MALIYTPGPWEARQADDKSAKYWIRGDRWIGQVGNGTNGEESHKFAEGNAALIASAPCLLAALEEIAEYWGEPIPIEANARVVAKMSAETREAMRKIAKDAILSIQDKRPNAEVTGAPPHGA